MINKFTKTCSGLNPSLRPLVAFSIASGIGSMGMSESKDCPEGHALFQRLVELSDQAISRWPVKLKTTREFDRIKRSCDHFDDLVSWSGKPRHTQTYMAFLAAIFESYREIVTNMERKQIIESVLEAINDLFIWYSNGKDREYEWCLQAGIRAANQWHAVMRGDL